MRAQRSGSVAAAVAAIVLSFALGACASQTPTTPQSTPPSTPGGTVTETSRPPFQTTTPGPIVSGTPSGIPSGTPIAEVPSARWDAIVADLAARGVAGEPTLVSAEAVTFTDGSLGCPVPGQSYTQALVGGMRVVVSADGASYDYRFGRGDSPRLCTTPGR